MASDLREEMLGMIVIQLQSKVSRWEVEQQDKYKTRTDFYTRIFITRTLVI